MSRTKGQFRCIFINYLQIAHIEKFIKKGAFCPTVLFLRLLTYYLLGIGRCFGGFFLKYSNNKFITSETGRACFSLIPSRNLCISSVVLIPINFVRFCFMSFTMLNNIILKCNENNAKLYKTI